MTPDEKPTAIRKFVAPEIVFGEGALSLAGPYAANFGAGKVLLVTGPHIRKIGWTGKVEQSLQEAGIAYTVFDAVTPNPKDHEVMAGAATYLAEKCDAIVVVGGGSPLDCAKAIGVVATNGQHVLEFEGIDEVERPGPPLICIPTTAGTSADVSQFSIITDTSRKIKIAIISKAMVPDVSLIDPDTTLTMDPALTAATGMDALVHAMEAGVSNASSTLTDLNALEAIRLVIAHLPSAVRDPRNRQHRNRMMMGSLLGGLAFSNASLGLVHGMAHALGGRLNLPHGQCNAILLEHVVAYNFDAAQEQYSTIGRIMGLDMTGTADERRSRLVRALSDFRKSVGITQTLRELGVTPADIGIMARNALQDPCLATNPVQPGAGDIEAIYEKAL